MSMYTFDQLKKLKANHDYNVKYGFTPDAHQQAAHEILGENGLTEEHLRQAGLETRHRWSGNQKAIHINDWSAHMDAGVEFKNHATDMAELNARHKTNIASAKNASELKMMEEMHAAERKILVDKHIEGLKWKHASTGERMAHRWNNVKSAYHTVGAPGRWAQAKATTFAKYGVAAGAVGLGLAWLMNRKGAEEGVQAAIETNNAAPDTMNANPQVMTAEAAMPPMPEPLGVGPNGKPYYGPNSARQVGAPMEQAMNPNPGMSFEDAGAAAKRLAASKDVSGQPSLAV